MIRRLGFFLGSCLTLWATLLLAAWFIWPDLRTLSVYSSLAAFTLCVVPASLTMLWALWSAKTDPNQQALATLGSSGVRMFFVLGLGFVLVGTVPLFQEHPKPFWFWILIFYLVTLGLEVTMIALALQKQLALSKANQQPEPAGEPVQQ